jgi:hypothetical protein
MKKPIILTEATRDKLAAFIESTAGKEVLDAMRRIAPLPNPAESHSIAFAAGATRGWNDCLDVLEDLNNELVRLASASATTNPESEENLPWHKQ